MAPTSNNRSGGKQASSSGDGRSSSRTGKVTAGPASFTSADDVEATSAETESATTEGSSSTSSTRAERTGTAAKSGAARGTKGRGRPARRIRLTLARLDPFSVMKLSFLLAVAIGIATVVAVAILWGVVDGIGLWDSLNKLGEDLNGGTPLPFMEMFTFSKMVSYATVVAFVNLVIITALGTLFAFLYNIVASLLGGLKMTFTDE